MIETELKAGDVVVLKSGSIPMTIEKLFEDQNGKLCARCKFWDHAKNELSDSVIPTILLKLEDKPA